jgi:hypothetical protein
MLHQISERSCQALLFALARLSCILSVLVFLGGCVSSSTTASQISTLVPGGDRPRILLMTPDVKYYLWTAGGVAEPQAEWTEAARENFLNSATNNLNARDTDLVVMGKSVGVDEVLRRYEKLHEAVGQTIMVNHFGLAKLPSKNGVFDWSLGPGVEEIGEQYEADYALFVFYRDYQSSGGRVAMSVVLAALGGGMATSAEFGFASLVDLKTGNVVWFNIISAGAGELRDAAGANKTVDQLLKDWPAS